MKEGERHRLAVISFVEPGFRVCETGRSRTALYGQPEDAMLRLIGFGLAIATLLYGFTAARTFARTRLRYVDAVRTAKGPLIAGVVAGVIALPVFAVLPLPFFTAWTAVFFGVSVGAGVRVGGRRPGTAVTYAE
jgi:hypothetical protein